MSGHKCIAVNLYDVHKRIECLVTTKRNAIFSVGQPSERIEPAPNEMYCVTQHGVLILMLMYDDHNVTVAYSGVYSIEFADDVRLL